MFFLEAWFPQVLESSFSPPVPNPTLELQEVQSSSLLPRMPILALEWFFQVLSVLNLSLLQLSLKEEREAISENHVSRPSEVGRYCPSAISGCKELALSMISMKLIWLLIFIPRQILANDNVTFNCYFVRCMSHRTCPNSKQLIMAQNLW